MNYHTFVFQTTNCYRFGVFFFKYLITMFQYNCFFKSFYVFCPPSSLSPPHIQDPPFLPISLCNKGQVRESLWVEIDSSCRGRDTEESFKRE